MRPVRPIDPIRPIRGIRHIALRRVPSLGQLRVWLGFARQKAKAARPPASGQAAIVPPDTSADWQSEEEAKLAADHGHIDKRA